MGVRPVGLFFAVVAVENCIIVVLKKGHMRPFLLKQ